MKKRVQFLLLTVFTLLSGCVTAIQTSIKNDGIMQNFAYVVGKSGDQQSFIFRQAGQGQFSYNSEKLFFADGRQYTIQKVHPGAYYTTEMSTYSSQRNATISAGGQPLLSVFLEPGKITYIGDVRLIVSGAPGLPPPGMSDLYAGTRSSVSFTKDVQDNSEAVKDAIRRDHPELTNELLDAIFIYRPAK